MGCDGLRKQYWIIWDLNKKKYKRIFYVMVSIVGVQNNMDGDQNRMQLCSKMLNRLAMKIGKRKDIPELELNNSRSSTGA